MKLIYPLFLMVLLVFTQALSLVHAEESFEHAIKSEEGEFLVKVEPGKRVEVKKVDPAPGAPPHLRLRLYRENDRPMEVRLHTLEIPGEGVKYAGELDRWNDSVVGLQLEFSFDKKTWKKLGERIKRIF